MSETIFRIDQLHYQYEDGTSALHNLTLSIKKGKKIALLGNNGAGKSTFFQHLNGILQPTSGHIYFKEEKLNYSRKALLKLRNQVGIVFQDPDSQLFAGTVKQDIAFGPMNLGWSKEKVEKQVEWAMKKADVLSLQDRPIHFLSIGQKKRVAIAGVIAMNPEVLILDEPSAGLDAYYTNQIKGLLDEIHNEHTTIILSTHNVHFAYEWADEIIIMSEGRILYYGDPVSAFYEEQLLEKAHLEKPWIFEVAEQLNTRMESMPRSKETLFEYIKQLK